jgi:hypothetical protein
VANASEVAGSLPRKLRTRRLNNEPDNVNS